MDGPDRNRMLEMDCPKIELSLALSGVELRLGLLFSITELFLEARCSEFSFIDWKLHLSWGGRLLLAMFFLVRTELVSICPREAATTSL